MAKTCGTCNHKEVCKWAINQEENIKCSDWQAIRYTGKWIKVKNGFKCSECGEEAADQFSYCPDCGSSMMYEVL